MTLALERSFETRDKCFLLSLIAFRRKSIPSLPGNGSAGSMSPAINTGAETRALFIKDWITQRPSRQLASTVSKVRSPRSDKSGNREVTEEIDSCYGGAVQTDII